MRCLQFFRGELQERGLAVPLGAPLFDEVQLTSAGTKLRQLAREGFPRGQDVAPQEGVQQLDMIVPDQQGLRFVLTVHVDQVLAQRAQGADGHNAPVDPVLVASRTVDLP